MSITIRMEGSTEPLSGLEAYLEKCPEKAAEIGQAVFDEIKPALLEALRFYPGVPAGSRYVRTFTLRNNWEVTFESTQVGFQIAIRNSTRYALWVVGSLAQNANAAKRFQRDFHAQHGWPLATNTAKTYFDKFTDEFVEAFASDLQEFTSVAFRRRAVTRIE